MTHLVKYVELFEKWNRSINLSAARTKPEIEEHVADCLAIIPHLERLAPHRVLDVGSGGGLPSVVIAASLPAIHVTALEPVHKKHAFLRTAARELGLSNFTPLAQRLEDHPDRDYDVATSRATFDLLTWLGMGSEVVRPGGVVIGFEAVPRELPVGATRTAYDLAGKQRALVFHVKHPA